MARAVLCAILEPTAEQNSSSSLMSAGVCVCVCRPRTQDSCQEQVQAGATLHMVCEPTPPACVCGRVINPIKKSTTILLLD